MTARLLRVIYFIEFLLALIAVYTVWSQVGGQTHLDLMPWFWKAAIGIPAAYAFVCLTVAIVSDGPLRLRRIVGWSVLLGLLAISAGLMTYYAHLNEPQDEDTADDGAITPTAYKM
jgi:glucan phosphoethanolaminetransferase (alkaline phosphatase superfamily)